MANYVANRVTIDCDKATFEAIKQFVASDEREFDLENIIPLTKYAYEETWGSSSNANYGYLKNKTYYFETRWCQPYKAIAALAKKFPKAKITHKYASDDRGNCCGVYVYRNGELLSHEKRDRKFANRMLAD